MPAFAGMTEMTFGKAFQLDLARRTMLWFKPKGLELYVIPTEAEGSQGIPSEPAIENDVRMKTLPYFTGGYTKPKGFS